MVKKILKSANRSTALCYSFCDVHNEVCRQSLHDDSMEKMIINKPKAIRLIVVKDSYSENLNIKRDELNENFGKYCVE